MGMAWIVALSMVVAGGPGATVKPMPVPPAQGEEVWRLTLPEAIRIGLKNSEAVRVVAESPGSETGAKPDAVGMTIARTADGPACDFHEALMAHVRSIEQQYWALSQQQIQLWSRQMAVKLGEEIVRRERAELESGRGTTAEVAEAQQNLERFQLAFVTATSDTITTERQLRNILGLPPTDHRRIVPVTAPLEARFEPDWESCLAAMMLHQPDILRHREAVAKAERQECTAADAARTTAPAGLPAEVVADFKAHEAKSASDRQRASLQQAIHQATHALARFTLEIDANYKQFQTAKRLREAACVRLKNAQVYYEEGRTGFTVDRLLDAVSQCADAIVQEAQYKTSYNTSIAALGEAKGTLLADCKIAVVEPKGHAEASAKAVVMAVSPKVVKDPKTGVIGVDFDFNFKPAVFTTPAAPTPVDAPKPVAPKAEARLPWTIPIGRVIKYDIAIEGGPLPVGLKGTVSIGAPASQGTDRR